MRRLSLCFAAAAVAALVAVPAALADGPLFVTQGGAGVATRDGAFHYVAGPDGRTLAVYWRSGRPWLRVAVGTWRISHPRAGFRWLWVGAGIGGGLVLLAAAGLLRRRRSEEVEEHARQELGLA